MGLNLNILLGNYPAYGYKTKDLENLKKGDFVKIFGQVKKALITKGKNIKMFVFCLLSS